VGYVEFIKKPGGPAPALHGSFSFDLGNVWANSRWILGFRVSFMAQVGFGGSTSCCGPFAFTRFDWSWSKHCLESR
jgi:hypothetical protein